MGGCVAKAQQGSSDMNEKFGPVTVGFSGPHLKTEEVYDLATEVNLLLTNKTDEEKEAGVYPDFLTPLYKAPKFALYNEEEKGKSSPAGFLNSILNAMGVDEGPAQGSSDNLNYGRSEYADKLANLATFFPMSSPPKSMESEFKAAGDEQYSKFCYVWNEQASAGPKGRTEGGPPFDRDDAKKKERLAREKATADWKNSADPKIYVNPFAETENHQGWTLDDFCKHKIAQRACLKREEVAALRLYTGGAFSHIQKSIREEKNVYPTTIYHLFCATYKLAHLARKPTGYMWRGIGGKVDYKLYKKLVEESKNYTAVKEAGEAAKKKGGLMGTPPPPAANMAKEGLKILADRVIVDSGIGSHSMDMHVALDFSGVWNKQEDESGNEKPDDKIRTGHVFFQVGCGSKMAPVRWCSQYPEQQEWITPPMTHYRYLRGAFNGMFSVFVLDLKFPCYFDVKNKIAIEFEDQTGLFGGSEATLKIGKWRVQDLKTAHRERERKEAGRGADFWQVHFPQDLQDQGS